MLNVFVAMTSSNPGRAAEVVPVWQTAGYKVALTIPGGMKFPSTADVIIEAARPWAGYFPIVGEMASFLVRNAEHADAVIFAAERMMPEPGIRAAELAADFLARFPDGFGVDGVGDGGPLLVGRGWVERAYGGRGPFALGYRSARAADEVVAVARKLGVLWGRATGSPFAGTSNDRELDEALFRRREAAGWPGHEPLPATRGKR